MACLVITEGAESGRRLALEQHRIVMIGRGQDCTFQVLDDRVSRHHLQLKAGGGPGGHSAVDFGSANGVFVNGARIAAETPLADGDLIRIGSTSLVYMTEDAPDAQRVAEAVKKRGELMRTTMVFDPSREK